MKTQMFTALALGALAGLAAAPAHALTFADYGAAPNGSTNPPNIQWTHSTGTLSSVGVTDPVVFSFLTGNLAGFNNLSANFTLNATSTAPAVFGFGQVFQQPIDNGTFSFIYTGINRTIGSVTITTGENLLSGTFSGLEIGGPVNGSAGSGVDSILGGGSVTFTSSVAGISPTGDKALGLEFTSLVPFLNAIPGQDLNSFKAISTGSFASDLTGNGGGGGTPEPATWALMVVGVGAIGFIARRRASKVALA